MPYILSYLAYNTSTNLCSTELIRTTIQNYTSQSITDTKTGKKIDELILLNSEHFPPPQVALSLNQHCNPVSPSILIALGGIYGLEQYLMTLTHATHSRLQSMDREEKKGTVNAYF